MANFTAILIAISAAIQQHDYKFHKTEKHNLVPSNSMVLSNDLLVAKSGTSWLFETAPG
jgi:hypothetical protein